MLDSLETPAALETMVGALEEGDSEGGNPKGDDRGKGRAASFLFRWYCQGGHLKSEIHPIALEWVEAIATPDWFARPGSLPAGAAVIDHEAFLAWVASSVTATGSARAIILDAEQIEEAAAEASGEKESIDCPRPELSAHAWKFVSDRTVWALGIEDGRFSVIVADEDRSDPVFSDLLKAIDEEPNGRGRKLRSILERSRDSSAITIIEVLAREQKAVRVTVALSAADPLRWLQTRMAALPSTVIIAAGPVAGTILASRLATFTGRPLAESAPRPSTEQITEHVTEHGRVPSPACSLQVLEDGTLGSHGGIPRALKAAARHILYEWQREPAQVPSFLGCSPELEHIFAEGLKRGGVRVYPSTGFGSRNRTVERIPSEMPGVFIADSRPMPLPAFVRRAIIRRLPFPVRSDPEVLTALARLSPEGDAFQEVILPRMLRKLWGTISILRANGVEPLLLDKRALVHTSYRREIEALFGRLQAVPRVAPGEEPGHLDEVCTVIADGLERAGLREGRDAFRNVDPTPVLHRLYGRTASWLPHQEEITRRILAGEDLLAVMPTGSGKSACFQIPAWIFGELGDYLTVVVSPLLALMRDQVNGLKRRGFWGVECINSEVDPETRARILRDIRLGWVTLLYLAPEQLLNEIVLDAIMERGVRLLVVDEAHCISEWGHEFRPEYRRIPMFLDELARERAEERPQVAAFTATATVNIQKDICELLRIESKPIVTGIRRSNLFPSILPLNNGVDQFFRLQQISEFLSGRPGKPGVIYVTTREGTRKVAEMVAGLRLPGFPPESVDYLHSGVKDRAERERRFIEPGGKTLILASTTAFGMGVDKPDLAWIIHYDAPGSIEAYYQEIGRAARDPSLCADCLAMASPEDLAMRRRMARMIDDDEITALVEHLRRSHPDPGAFFVNPTTLSYECGLDEDRTRAALFALERAGILRIDARAAGIIRRESGVVIRPSSRMDRSERGAFLKQLDLAEERLAAWLWRRFVESSGRAVTLTVADQLEICKSLEMSLEQLDGILLDWRLARLVISRHALFHIRLMLNMNVDLPQAVAGSRAQRRALMDACEELWASGEYIMTSSRFPFGERQMRSLLGSLARRGVLKWEEQSEGAGAYRVEFQSPESEDSLNIASLNLRQLQNMVDRRQDALRELFSKPRGPEEIWDFLEEYFSRNSRDPREAFVREAVVRGLTPQQREAVEASPRQPLLINAAAGTGKTHVLARRLLLLQAVEHIDGDKILVLSFSRAGARAIGERIDQLAKELGLKPVRAMTFHSFCHSILKMQGNDAKLVGAKPVSRPGSG